MRTFTPIVLAVLASGSLATAQGPEQGELAGIWHACAEVGAGYCERWVLAPDGRFEVRPAQEGCGRLALRSGRWALEGSTLLVTERAHTRWVGGRCVRDEAGAALVGARAVTRSHVRAIVARLPLGECSTEERDRSPAECRRFGGTLRWRLATDESMDPTTGAP